MIRAQATCMCVRVKERVCKGTACMPQYNKPCHCTKSVQCMPVYKQRDCQCTTTRTCISYLVKMLRTTHSSKLTCWVQQSYFSHSQNIMYMTCTCTGGTLPVYMCCTCVKEVSDGLPQLPSLLHTVDTVGQARGNLMGGGA